MSWIRHRRPNSEDANFVGLVLIPNPEDATYCVSTFGLSPYAYSDWKDVPDGASWRPCLPTYVRPRMDTGL